MRRMQKSKRVSWASDLSLRQEKLFLSEDPPSQVNQRPQNQLQSKKKSTTGFHSYNHFPSNQMKLRKSAVSPQKYQCPPTFQLKPNWLNAAGEESKERQVQNQREMRVLEAFYPHPSVIPPNPVVSSEVKNSYYNDDLTPAIRLTPVEVVNVASPLEEPVNLQSSTLAPLARNLATPTSTKQAETLIDLDLLVKILSNPKVVQTLIADLGKPSDLEPASKPSSPPTLNSSIPHSCLAAAPANVNSKELGTTWLAAPVMNVVAPASIVNTPQHGVFHVSSPVVKSPSPPPLGTNVVAPISNPNLPLHGISPAMKECPTNLSLKDISYCKSLIQQHGIARPTVHNQNLGNFGKNKRKLPNARGASWNGGSTNFAAAYQPDISFRQQFSYNTIPQAHCTKRMKLNQEMLGRTF